MNLDPSILTRMDNLPDTQHRVTGTERELAISRLQDAYIRGQLSEHELGERIDRALGAVVALDLADLVKDLPAPAPAPASAAVPAASAGTLPSPWWRRRGAGKVSRVKGRKGYDVYKSTVRKNGAWSVPPVYASSAYKSVLILDLRQAVLSAAQTVIELDAYKSQVAVIVPPEYGVELEGSPYKGSMQNLTSGGQPDAPRLLIRSKNYKSSIIVAHRDPYFPESP
jgi:hypothetical protein